MARTRPVISSAVSPLVLSPCSKRRHLSRRRLAGKIASSAAGFVGGQVLTS